MDWVINVIRIWVIERTRKERDLIGTNTQQPLLSYSPNKPWIQFNIESIGFQLLSFRAYPNKNKVLTFAIFAERWRREVGQFKRVSSSVEIKLESNFCLIYRGTFMIVVVAVNCKNARRVQATVTTSTARG